MSSKPIDANSPATPVSAAELAFTGVIEIIDGTQWTVNAEMITVVATVVREGPFNVGDTIKIDGVENSDGSFAVTRVGSATPEDIAGLPKFGTITPPMTIPTMSTPMTTTQMVEVATIMEAMTIPTMVNHQVPTK